MKPIWLEPARLTDPCLDAPLLTGNEPHRPPHHPLHAADRGAGANLECAGSSPAAHRLGGTSIEG
jgi:hypothetical protein